MDDAARLIAETTGRLFAERGDPRELNRAADEGWRRPLWRALEEAGLTRAWLAEEAGGAGVSARETWEVLRVAGAHACPVALAETLLAGRLLAEAGLGVPAGELALAPVRLGDGFVIDEEGRVTGRARAVPHVAAAATLVVVATAGERQVVAIVPPDAAAATPRRADMGDGRADLALEGVQALDARPLPDGWSADTPMALGAALRAAQMAGALEGVLALAVTHALEREAFGRPIARFQAIQHALARLAGEVAAALAVSGAAMMALDEAWAGSAGGHGDPIAIEVGAAKLRCGEAAYTGAMIAHQVHGAIGWTAEHVLQRYSRRLFAWRDDFGAESHWAAMLGDMVTDAGAEGLWPMVAVP